MIPEERQKILLKMQNHIRNSFLSGMLDNVEAIIYCETCGKIFVALPYSQLLKTDVFMPTKFMLKAGIHWCNNPTHIITSNLPKSSRFANLSEAWYCKKELEGLTRESLLESLEKLLRENEWKPI